MPISKNYRYRFYFSDGHFRSGNFYRFYFSERQLRICNKLPVTGFIPQNLIGNHFCQHSNVDMLGDLVSAVLVLFVITSWKPVCPISNLQNSSILLGLQFTFNVTLTLRILPAAALRVALHIEVFPRYGTRDHILKVCWATRLSLPACRRIQVVSPPLPHTESKFATSSRQVFTLW